MLITNLSSGVWLMTRFLRHFSISATKKGLLSLVAVAAFSVTQAASGGLVAFEFSTPGNDEGWQHNGTTNGGASDTTGPTAVTVSGTGEGVLTAQTAPGNGDLRVLYNPDISLPAGDTSWTTIDLRFRQLDGLNGNPQDLAGSLSLLHLGVSGAAPTSITGAGFVREDPMDTDYWYTASLDISGMGANDIEQIRFDPIASTTLSYQLDWVRVNAVPEPAGLALSGCAGALGLALVRRNRK